MWYVPLFYIYSIYLVAGSCGREAVQFFFSSFVYVFTLKWSTTFVWYVPRFYIYSTYLLAVIFSNERLTRWAWSGLADLKHSHYFSSFFDHSFIFIDRRLLHDFRPVLYIYYVDCLNFCNAFEWASIFRCFCYIFKYLFIVSVYINLSFIGFSKL